MYTVGLVLFVIHILAFVAGGANAVVGPVVGSRLATASPDLRPVLIQIIEAVSKVGKYAMIVLLVSGLLVLWLKWDFNVPNGWFWVKMAGVVGMLVCIGINEGATKRAFAGDAAAFALAQRLGQLTGLFFLLVVVGAVFAFN